MDPDEALSRVFGLRVSRGRMPATSPLALAALPRLCFLPRPRGAVGSGLVTRYRSATAADSHGVPRPLSAYSPARAEENFQTTSRHLPSRRPETQPRFNSTVQPRRMLLPPERRRTVPAGVR